MLPDTSIIRRYGFWMLILSLVIASFSFVYDRQEGGPFRSFQSFRLAASSFVDTIPGKEQEGSALDDRTVLDKELNNRSVEQTLKNIEYSLKRLEEELRSNNWSKAERSYRKAIDNVNLDQIAQNARRALTDVDKKIRLENEVHLNRLRTQLNNMQVMQQRQFNIDHDIKISLQNAAQGLQRVKISLQQLKAFTADLEKDGLIEKDKPCSVEIKNGELYINDVKQLRRVTKKYREKYRTYFEDKGGFIISRYQNY